MKILTPEHRKTGYMLDFVLNGFAILALALFLLIAGPRHHVQKLRDVVAKLQIW
nr:hypothetical protein [uncultured Undibacterium sp.]